MNLLLEYDLKTRLLFGEYSLIGKAFVLHTKDYWFKSNYFQKKKTLSNTNPHNSQKCGPDTTKNNYRYKIF